MAAIRHLGFVGGKSWDDFRRPIRGGYPHKNILS